MPPKFATLNSLRGKDNEDDSPTNGRAGNSLYAGSGQNIIGRPDPSKAAAGGNGAGGEDPRDAIFKMQSQEGSSPSESSEIVIYKNGFTIDGGDVRSLDDAENREILESILEGEIPAGLFPDKRKKGGMVEVNIVDKRGEDAPAPAFKAFTGSGATLGRSSAVAATAVVSAASAGSKEVVVDAALPTTVIQVRLLDGRRERITLNLTNTVADLQTKVALLKGTTKAFLLNGGFPPKPLDNATLTIEAAGLKGAAVTQVAVA